MALDTILIDCDSPGSPDAVRLGALLAPATGANVVLGKPRPGEPNAFAVAPRGFADDPDPGVRVVGVAFDGSRESRMALAVAEDLALVAGAAIRLIGVVQEPPKPTAGMNGAWVAADYDYRAALRHELDAVADSLPRELRAQVVLLDGDPVERLTDQAGTLSLLVIGSHGRGRLLRALLGSVSAAVMRDPPCPVLVVPRDALHERAAA